MSFISLERDQKQFKTKTKGNKDKRSDEPTLMRNNWANIQEENLG